MKTFKYNRALATVVLVAVIILSTVFGVARTVNSYSSKVEKLYDSTLVLSDLRDLSGYASKILAIGSSTGADTQALGDAISGLNNNLSDPTAVSEYVDVILTEASVVYNDALYSGKLDDTTSLVAYMANVDSTNMRLKHNSEYNAAAKKYNSVIKSFPASVFAIGRDSAVIFG